MDVIRFDNRDALMDKAAADIAALINSVEGPSHVVLTGGTVGVGTLERLRDQKIDWSQVHIYFGDERNVPLNDPESNEGQARAALLDHIDIPEQNIHGWRMGELSLEEACERYATLLPAKFDLHLLGMGGEGHINSLFPDTPAVKEETKLTLPVTDSPKPPAERGTLTLPAVHRAKEIWLLVSGPEKAEAAQHVIDGAAAVDWPAAGAGATRFYLN
ncbi:MAG: 6-phosphogluconolactonase [Corynebacterium sp.]|nr:6-phosphogluconolactonase [Corynebacterium sp.]